MIRIHSIYRLAFVFMAAVMLCPLSGCDDNTVPYDPPPDYIPSDDNPGEDDLPDEPSEDSPDDKPVRKDWPYDPLISLWNHDLDLQYGAYGRAAEVHFRGLE